MTHPRIIQGGMGVGVSDWRLARAVSRQGAVGVVSGTALDSVLAATMATRTSGRVDGIIVENHSAGGHNAPPRGVLSLDADGKPIYGPKDSVDYARMVGLGLPFWLGGSYLPSSDASSRLARPGTPGASATRSSRT